MEAMAFVGFITVVTLVSALVVRGTIFRGERWASDQERAACERAERICRA